MSRATSSSFLVKINLTCLYEILGRYSADLKEKNKQEVRLLSADLVNASDQADKGVEQQEHRDEVKTQGTRQLSMEEVPVEEPEEEDQRDERAPLTWSVLFSAPKSVKDCALQCSQVSKGLGRDCLPYQKRRQEQPWREQVPGECWAEAR